MLFSRHRLRWIRAQWGRVMFSDESRFRLRRKEQRYNDKFCMLERERFGGESVTVLRGTMGGRKTYLVIINYGNLDAHGYVDQI